MRGAYRSLGKVDVAHMSRSHIGASRGARDERAVSSGCGAPLLLLGKEFERRRA